MITFEGQGDVFNCDAHTIACPVNAAGAMGKGLALEFKERVPGLEAFYLAHYPRGREFENEHSLHVFPVPDGRQVLLIPTKRHWRESSNTWLIRRNLESLAATWQHLGIQSLALPALGCGLGNLHYPRDVQPLIHEILGPLPLPVQVLFS